MSVVRFTLAVVLCLAAMLMAASAVTVSAKFVEDYIINDSTAIVEFTFANWDGIAIRFSPDVRPVTPPVVPAPTLWSIDPTPSHHAELVLGYKSDPKTVCWDVVTGQIFAEIQFLSGKFYILALPRWRIEVEFATADGADPIYTGTIRCPVGINSEVVPTGFAFSYDNNADTGVPADDTSYFDLAFPAKGFVTPLIDFKAASLTQASDDRFSTTEIKVEFTTDTAGTYTLSLVNGPVYADSRNHNDGKWADFWCSVGSNKKAVRIQYTEDHLLLYVTAPSTKDSIKCTVLYSNENGPSVVASERIAVQIKIADVIVSRSLDYKLLPAGVTARVSSLSGTDLSISVLSTRLFFTATPIQTNSTVVFKFSKHIDVSTVQLKETGGRDTSYHNNQNCKNLQATSFVDSKANTITLKNADPFSSAATFTSFDCTFEFSGSEVFKYQDSADMATVLVSIDGNDLVATQATTKEAPIYFETVGTIKSTEQTVSEANGVYTVVDIFSFNDNYSDMHTNMRNPMLMVNIRDAQLFNMDDYSKQITSCEATSPTSTKFEALKLKFDEKLFFWSVKLDKLVSTDSYSILIKCTRSFPKLTKYGLDITPESSLSLGVYNLLDGKRYFGYSSLESSGFKPVQPVATPASSVYPERIVQFGALSQTLIVPSVVSLYTPSEQFLASTALAILKATPAQSAYTFQFFQSEGSFDCNNYPYLNLKHSDEAFQLFAKNHPALTSFTVFPPRQVTNAGYFDQILWQEVGACAIKTTHRFVATEPDLATKDYVEWNDRTTTAYKDAIKANFGAKFNTEFVNPEAALDSSGSLGLITPITGCGVDAGYYLSALSLTNYFKPAADADQATLDQHWIDFKSAASDHGYLYCMEGEKCTYNADCAAGICKGGVCAMAQFQYYPSPYAEVSGSQSKAFDKAYFNSATMASTLMVIAFVALSIVVA